MLCEYQTLQWVESRVSDLHAAEGAVAGTTLLALSAGFLCVISLLSTLRRPFVTSSPRLSSLNTAPIPTEAGAAPEAAAGGGGATGGGGGGGGGGAPPVGAAVEVAALYCSRVAPCGE